jgi:UDP-glucose 4-epimerase
MTATHWVVGAGGLLGSAVSRSLARAGESVLAGPTVRWDRSAASADLAAGITALATQAARTEDGSWVIYWCAGASTTASDDAAFDREDETFREFLGGLAALPPALIRRGVLFCASSAGAVYAGSTDAPFTELSPVAPLGNYGKTKLRHEALARTLAEETGLRVAIGRIANLYGPGQSLAKQQGLVSRLCIASLTRAPTSIFVSIDTIRDYLYVDDCAALVTAMTLRMLEEPAASHTKILASGRSTTIGALIAELGQVTRRRPAIVWGVSAQSSLQASDLRLRSVTMTELDELPTTNLADGIAKTLVDLQQSFARASV